MLVAALNRCCSTNPALWPLWHFSEWPPSIKRLHVSEKRQRFESAWKTVKYLWLLSLSNTISAVITAFTTAGCRSSGRGERAAERKAKSNSWASPLSFQRIALLRHLLSLQYLFFFCILFLISRPAKRKVSMLQEACFSLKHVSKYPLTLAVRRWLSKTTSNRDEYIAV